MCATAPCSLWWNNCVYRTNGKVTLGWSVRLRNCINWICIKSRLYIYSGNPVTIFSTKHQNPIIYITLQLLKFSKYFHHNASFKNRSTFMINLLLVCVLLAVVPGNTSTKNFFHQCPYLFQLSWVGWISPNGCILFVMEHCVNSQTHIL